MSPSAKMLKIKSEIVVLESLIDEVIDKTKKAIEKSKNKSLKNEDLNFIYEKMDTIDDKNEEIMTNVIFEDEVVKDKTTLEDNSIYQKDFFDVSNVLDNTDKVKVDDSILIEKNNLEKENEFSSINEFNENDSIIEHTVFDYNYSENIEKSTEMNDDILLVKVIYKNNEETTFHLKNKVEIQKMFDKRVNKQVNLKQIDKVSRKNQLIKPNKNLISRLKYMVDNVLNLFKKKNKKK